MQGKNPTDDEMTNHDNGKVGRSIVGSMVM
jgi:hypothetical protein